MKNIRKQAIESFNPILVGSQKRSFHPPGWRVVYFMFQSYFSWKSKKKINCLNPSDVILTSFNPILVGSQKRSAISPTPMVFGLLFQSYFSWKSKKKFTPPLSSSLYLPKFQSYFSWKSKKKLCISCISFLRIRVSILFQLEVKKEVRS